MAGKLEISHRFLERGESIADVDMTNLSIIDCHTAQGPSDDLRPRIENVRLSKLRVNRSSLTGAVLRDVTVDGLTMDSKSCFWNANEYHNVTIRGKVSDIVIQRWSQDAEFNDAYQAHLRGVDLSSDWSLDISEAEGDIEIRNYATSRIRLHPEYQKAISRERLLDGRWRNVDLSGSYFTAMIDMMVRQQWNEIVLVANPRSKQFKTELAALRRLTDEGIID